VVTDDISGSITIFPITRSGTAQLAIPTHRCGSREGRYWAHDPANAQSKVPENPIRACAHNSLSLSALRRRLRAFERAADHSIDETVSLVASLLKGWHDKGRHWDAGASCRLRCCSARVDNPPNCSKDRPCRLPAGHSSRL